MQIENENKKLFCACNTSKNELKHYTKLTLLFQGYTFR